MKPGIAPEYEFYTKKLDWTPLVKYRLGYYPFDLEQPVNDPRNKLAKIDVQMQAWCQANLKGKYEYWREPNFYMSPVLALESKDDAELVSVTFVIH